MKSKGFIGTKVILSFGEMSRKEYCEYRGWKLPENENGDDRVYLVEYAPDPTSKPNHPNHEGYISMSPKHVFEEAYSELLRYEDLTEKSINMLVHGYDDLQPHQKRIAAEFSELDRKTDDLMNFITSNPRFETLPDAEQSDLNKQYLSMLNYRTCLVSRINRW